MPLVCPQAEKKARQREKEKERKRAAAEKKAKAAEGARAAAEAEVVTAAAEAAALAAKYAHHQECTVQNCVLQTVLTVSRGKDRMSGLSTCLPKYSNAGVSCGVHVVF